MNLTVHNSRLRRKSGYTEKSVRALNKKKRPKLESVFRVYRSFCNFIDYIKISFKYQFMCCVFWKLHHCHMIYRIVNRLEMFCSKVGHIWYFVASTLHISWESVISKIVQFFIMKYKLAIRFDIKRLTLSTKRTRFHTRTPLTLTHQIENEWELVYFWRCHAMMHTYSICGWCVSVNCWTTTKANSF